MMHVKTLGHERRPYLAILKLVFSLPLIVPLNVDILAILFCIRKMAK